MKTIKKYQLTLTTRTVLFESPTATWNSYAAGRSDGATTLTVSLASAGVAKAIGIFSPMMFLDFTDLGDLIRCAVSTLVVVFCYNVLAEHD